MIDKPNCDCVPVLIYKCGIQRAPWLWYNDSHYWLPNMPYQLFTYVHFGCTTTTTCILWLIYTTMCVHIYVYTYVNIYMHMCMYPNRCAWVYECVHVYAYLYRWVGDMHEKVCIIKNSDTVMEFCYFWNSGFSYFQNFFITYIHACTYMHMHKHIYIIYTCIDSGVSTCLLTYIHSYMHTFMWMHTYILIHVFTDSCMFTYKHV